MFSKFKALKQHCNVLDMYFVLFKIHFKGFNRAKKPVYGSDIKISFRFVFRYRYRYFYDFFYERNSV
jgi:hypothetical protein